jgi:nitroreductase
MLDLLYQRRSIRQYKNIPVEEEKVRQLVKAAVLAPSAQNNRSQRFIVVNDQDLLEKLARAKEHGSAFLKNAPLAIVVTGDSKAVDVWTEDAALAAIILQLTAKSLGLDSCWVQIRERRHDENTLAEQYVQELLQIPKEVRVVCIVAIGYAQEEKPPRTDQDLSLERVFYNHFGNDQ